MPLSGYGLLIRSYQGTWTLHLQSGTAITCSFDAVQCVNGDVLVLSHTSADVWEDDAATAFSAQTIAATRIGNVCAERRNHVQMRVIPTFVTTL